jgi:hypothetical protein
MIHSLLLVGLTYLSDLFHGGCPNLTEFKVGVTTLQTSVVLGEGVDTFGHELYQRFFPKPKVLDENGEEVLPEDEDSWKTTLVSSGEDRPAGRRK